MNNTQLLNLNESEMLALCKRVMKLETARRDCAVERDDGIDIDAWILTHARAWYARLLLEAPVGWLPVEDLKSEITLSTTNDGVVEAMLPDRYVRPIEFKLDGWHTSVTQFASPHDPIAQLQANPWTRGGTCQPVAVNHGDRLMLYSIAPDALARLTMARCVAVPQGGNYVFHAAAIPSLETALQPQLQ